MQIIERDDGSSAEYGDDLVILIGRVPEWNGPREHLDHDHGEWPAPMRCSAACSSTPWHCRLGVDVGVDHSFIGEDTTTEGNWIGTYGTQGYDVIGDAASLPSYATITPAGAVELHLGREHDRSPSPTGSPAAPAASPPAGTRRPASRWMST